MVAVAAGILGGNHTKISNTIPSLKLTAKAPEPVGLVGSDDPYLFGVTGC